MSALIFWTRKRSVSLHHFSWCGKLPRRFRVAKRHILILLAIFTLIIASGIIKVKGQSSPLESTLKLIKEIDEIRNQEQSLNALAKVIHEKIDDFNEKVWYSGAIQVAKGEVPRKMRFLSTLVDVLGTEDATDRRKKVGDFRNGFSDPKTQIVIISVIRPMAERSELQMRFESLYKMYLPIQAIDENKYNSNYSIRVR